MGQIAGSAGVCESLLLATRPRAPGRHRDGRHGPLLSISAFNGGERRGPPRNPPPDMPPFRCQRNPENGSPMDEPFPELRDHNLDIEAGYHPDEALCPRCHLTSHAALSTCPTCKENDS